MQLLDLGLWISAVALAVPALWWSRRVPRNWDSARLYRGILGVERLTTEAYQPVEWLGAGVTWENLRGPEAQKAIKRRLEHVKLLWMGPEMLELGMEAKGMEAKEMLDEATDTMLNGWLGSETAIVAASGKDAMSLLKFLHSAPGLRDRCRAVLLVDLQPDADWLQKHFNHSEFDTELFRQIPYLCLYRHAEGLLPTPPKPPTERTAIEVVDLGAPTDGAGMDLRYLLAALQE